MTPQQPTAEQRRAGAQLAARAAQTATGGRVPSLSHWVLLSFFFGVSLSVALNAQWWPMKVLAALVTWLHGARLVRQLRIRSVLREPMTVVVQVAGPARAQFIANALGRSLPRRMGAADLAAFAAQAAVWSAEEAQQAGCAGGHMPLCPHQLHGSGYASPADLAAAVRGAAAAV